MSKETVPSMGTVYRQQVNKWTRGRQCSRNTFTTFQREGCRNHRCCTSRHLRRLMCEAPVNWLFQIHIYHLPEGGLSISQAAEAWGIYSLPRCLFYWVEVQVRTLFFLRGVKELTKPNRLQGKKSWETSGASPHCTAAIIEVQVLQVWTINMTPKQAVQWCCICPRQLGTCRNHRCCTSRHLRRLMCEAPVNRLFQIQHGRSPGLRGLPPQLPAILDLCSRGGVNIPRLLHCR